MLEPWDLRGSRAEADY